MIKSAAEEQSSSSFLVNMATTQTQQKSSSRATALAGKKAIKHSLTVSKGNNGNINQKATVTQQKPPNSFNSIN